MLTGKYHLPFFIRNYLIRKLGSKSLKIKKKLKKLASLKSKNAQEIRNFLRVKIASLGKYKHLKGKSKY